MKFKRRETPKTVSTQLRNGTGHPFGAVRSYVPLGGNENALYRSMREALPILDAAICKLVRLTGGFDVECGDKQAQQGMEQFLKTVPCGRMQYGMEGFLSGYLDSLIMYGRAIGEMVVSGGQLTAVLWGTVDSVELSQTPSPLETLICAAGDDGVMRPLPRQHLLLFSTLNASPDMPYGAGLMRSMPFLTDVLLKIYNTIGVNWERAGNVRYSVVYKPSGDGLDRGYAQERAEQMAGEWSRAMQDSKNGTVRDFVAVGDVSVKVIGADGQILDSEVPVRQVLEQLVAKTGLPPFLLGLNWSSTERMSTQQADLLTSELWAIRRAVTPVLERICRLWLHLNGFGCPFRLVWDDISLQDIVDEAQAALYRAQAAEITGEERTDGD